MENLSLEYEQNWTKLRYWKNVANEKCTPEIGELSSVESLFWANHASEKALTIPKRKIYGWTNVPEKLKWLFSVISENCGRNGQKNAQNSLNSSKIAVLRLLIYEKPIKIDCNTSNWKLFIRRNENKQNNKRNKLQVAAPQNHD